MSFSRLSCCRDHLTNTHAVNVSAISQATNDTVPWTSNFANTVKSQVFNEALSFRSEKNAWKLTRSGKAPTKKKIPDLCVGSSKVAIVCLQVIFALGHQRQPLNGCRNKTRLGAPLCRRKNLERSRSFRDSFGGDDLPASKTENRWILTCQGLASGALCHLG